MRHFFYRFLPNIFRCVCSQHPFFKRSKCRQSLLNFTPFLKFRCNQPPCRAQHIIVCRNTNPIFLVTTPPFPSLTNNGFGTSLVYNILSLVTTYYEKIHIYIGSELSAHFLFFMPKHPLTILRWRNTLLVLRHFLYFTRLKWKNSEK